MKIAFDFDGTLVSCKQKQMNCLRYALSLYKIQVDLNHIWRLKQSGANTYDSLLNCGIDPIASKHVCLKWQASIEDPFWAKFDNLFGGVYDLLSGYYKQGIWLYLITARSRPEWVAPQLLRLGISEFFHKIQIVSPLSATKDKAEFLTEHEIEYYFGDSELDFWAAEKANVKFIGLSSGQRSKEFLVSKGIRHIFSNLSEFEINSLLT